MKTLMMSCCFTVLLFGCSQNSVGPGPIPTPNTAMGNLAIVNTLAMSYHQGLRLMLVETGRDGVNIDGRASQWLYVYVTASTPYATYWFHADTNGIGLDSIGAVPPGSGAITQAWFDSDSALAIAERNGGSQFRAQNPQSTVMAAVAQAVVPNPKSFWYISYYSNDNQEKALQINVDANSGEAFVIEL